MARPRREFSAVPRKDDLHGLTRNLERLKQAAADLLDNPRISGGLDKIWPPNDANLDEWRKLTHAHFVLLWQALELLGSLYLPLAEGARQLRDRQQDRSGGAAGAEPSRREGSEEAGEPIYRDADAWARELLHKLNFLAWAAGDLDEALWMIHHLMADVDLEGLPPLRDAA